MTTVARLHDVWFGYDGEPVIRGVSLSIGAGESVALLGRNGAGKTTLTRLIVALLHPQRGVVEAVGRNTTGLAPEDLADAVAYVFQHPDQQLFARTVHDEVAFGPRQQRQTQDVVTERTRRALESTGLTRHATAHPYDLGPAERKLVTLAAALAQEPRLILLDEPTQGLDRAGIAQVAQIIHEVSRRGVGVLGVTHDVSLVAEAFDRAAVLEAGQIVFDGPIASLIDDTSRLAELGLEAPPAAQLAVGLDLPGRPYREREVAVALRRREEGAGR